MKLNNDMVVGIDSGSSAIKLTTYDGDCLEHWITPTGWNPREAATSLLAKALGHQGKSVDQLSNICGTGYGRVGLDFLTTTVTEISCHAKGAAYLCPEARTVIDIGGQDAKAIRLESSGRVIEFIMNDKCAAGTGRFLQVMAHALGLDISELAQMEITADPCTISSMCAVFAESEVIGLLNQGLSRESIVAGLYKSIATRIGSMAAKIDPQSTVVLTGGLSHHQQLRKELVLQFKTPIVVPETALFAGSIGAALYAWEKRKQ